MNEGVSASNRLLDEVPVIGREGLVAVKFEKLSRPEVLNMAMARPERDHPDPG